MTLITFYPKLISLQLSFFTTCVLSVKNSNRMTFFFFVSGLLLKENKCYVLKFERCIGVLINPKEMMILLEMDVEIPRV